jgi:hypothetical protein
MRSIFPVGAVRDTDRLRVSTYVTSGSGRQSGE